MEKRRLKAAVVGTAATGSHAIEVNASMALEVDGVTTRVVVAPSGSPTRAQAREVTDPAVARWAEALHAEIERTARAEAYRNAPCSPNWKPAKTRRASGGTMVCPDCEGVGELAGAACVACDGRGWRKG